MPLVSEYLSLEDVTVGERWIEREHFRHQFVAPLEVGLRVGAEVVRDRLPELDRQNGQGMDIVGIGSERLFAEVETRFRFLADSFWGFPDGGQALESQIFGVGSCHRRPLETGG